MNAFRNTDRFTQICCFSSVIFSFHKIFAFYDEIIQKSLPFQHLNIFLDVFQNLFGDFLTFQNNLEIQDLGLGAPNAQLYITLNVLSISLPNWASEQRTCANYSDIKIDRIYQRMTSQLMTSYYILNLKFIISNVVLVFSKEDNKRS